MTIIQALEQQLGLSNWENAEVPATVTVIDDIEQMQPISSTTRRFGAGEG